MFTLKDHVLTNLYDASHKIKRDYRDYLNLASNELNHPILQELLQKYHSYYLPKIASHYPYYDELRVELTSFLELNRDSLLLSPGSDTAIATLLAYFSKNSKSLILQSPNYYNYRYYADLNQLDVLAISFVGKSRNEFVADFCKALQTSKPSLVVLTNPDPYEGGLLSLDQIRIILDMCNHRNHILIIDETYSKFSRLSHFELLKTYSNVIILHTLSKAYGAAGFRLASIMSSPDIIRLIFKTGIEYGVNLYALSYLKFVMDHQKEFDDLIEDIIINREYCINACRNRLKGWSISPSSSVFMTIDAHSNDLAQKLVNGLEQEKIIVRNLHQFDGKLSGKVRICMTNRATLNRVMSEIFRIYQKLENVTCNAT